MLFGQHTVLAYPITRYSPGLVMCGVCAFSLFLKNYIFPNIYSVNYFNGTLSAHCFFYGTLTHTRGACLYFLFAYIAQTWASLVILLVEQWLRSLMQWFLLK